MENFYNNFQIDLTSSWIIGNNDADILAGENAGCKDIKINSNNDLPNIVNQLIKD